MRVEFLAEGPAALVVNTERTLVVADLHFGIESDLERHGWHFSSRSFERMQRVTDLVDRVHGLDLGADYYLTKPFENAEFLACLRAVLRRQGDITPESLHFGDLTLTPSRGSLRCHERVLTLSARELEMMRLLMLNQNANETFQRTK